MEITSKVPMYVTPIFSQMLIKWALAVFVLSLSPSLQGTVRDITTLI